MTILCFERIPVDPNRVADFQTLVASLLVRMREAGGILWADLMKASDDEPSFVLLSEWRTPADADAWGSGDNAAAFAEAADVLLRGEVTRRRFGSA